MYGLVLHVSTHTSFMTGDGTDTHGEEVVIEVGFISRGEVGILLL